ncbi:MAG: alanine racemase [Caldisericia bacterium]|nr:alanine racemase [Caldisericia bacterium]
MKIEDLTTPALIVDYEKLMKNIEEMSNFAKSYKKNLRPMIKTHKSIYIAKIQKDFGISGIQCSKLSEGEVFAEEGFDDIFISSEIVDYDKLKRAKVLNKKVKKLILAVDSIEGIRKIDEIFDSEKIFVRIEINSGHNRCGIKPQDVLFLYKEIEKSKNIIFDGVFTHGGQVYKAKNKEEREKYSLEEANGVLEAKRILEKSGIKFETVSIGSTPSVFISGKIDGITEIRPGNYVFYDYKQVNLGVISIERCALFVLSQVISKPDESRAYIDAGAKVLGLDFLEIENEKNYGYILDEPQTKLFSLSEEHGWLKLTQKSKIKIGDKLKIIPVHSCITMSNFDYFYMVKGSDVIGKYKVDARGKFE